MKNLLYVLFKPLLALFESGTEEYSYKRSHRLILLAVGGLFLVLATISFIAASASAEITAFLPFVIFFAAAIVCLVVGGLGSDRAVAKIWGNR